MVTKQEIASDELRDLNSIIDRQEQVEHKIRGSCLALLVVLSAAYLAGKTKLDATEFTLAGIIISVAFYVYDAVHRVPKLKAYTRVSKVENFLQDTTTHYHGPNVGALFAGSAISAKLLRLVRECKLLLYISSAVSLPVCLGTCVSVESPNKQLVAVGCPNRCLVWLPDSRCARGAAELMRYLIQ